MPQFYNNPTVNESGTLVLLGKILDLCGKRKGYDAKGNSLTFDIFSHIPTVRVSWNVFQTWCSNFTTTQRLMILRSSFYWDIFECMWEKERVLGGGEGKMKLRGRGSVEMYRQPLFIARVLSTYYLLYFYLFIYYFINKYSILFPIKRINQISFFIFLQTIILIKLFLLIYLITKTSLFFF